MKKVTLMHILNCTTVCWADKTNKLLYLLFFLVTLSTSCQKKENSVGSDFVGSRNPFEVSYQDTTTLVAFTSSRDSFDTKVLRYLMLGQLNDPIMGFSKCDIITQFSLPVEQFNFGFDVPLVPTIDSIVLQLPYTTNTSYYGDTNAVQHLNVYELTEDLIYDSAYYSNRNYSSSSTLLGQYNGSYGNMSDSVNLAYSHDTIRLGPHIRVRLDNITPLFKDRFTLPDANSAGWFSTNVAFQQVFKGLVIKSTSISSPIGCLAYFNLYAPEAAVVIYYNDSLKNEFPIYQNTVHTNKFSNTINPSISIQPRLGGVHSDVNYLMPSALKTRITMPYLLDYVKHNKIAITGAELILTIKSGTTSTLYTPPKTLILTGSDSIGNIASSYDLDIGRTYYGGYIEGDSRYRFNIIRQLQYMINEYQNNQRNSNFGFNLYVSPYNPVTAQRLVLDTKRGAGSFKLNLTYTVIK